MDKTQAISALQNAVTYLKAKKIIKKDLEICEKTGYTSGSVSSYISGNSAPSKNFLAKFQEAFSLNLEDFVKENPVVLEFSHGVGIESVIRIESKTDVTLSYVAEIYAHLKDQPATKVLQDMVQMANSQSIKRLDELRKK